jgi:FAD/FMN-containing dehydrogenase/ferredoxin
VAVNYFERRNYSRDLARVPALLEKTLHRTTPWIVIQPRSEQDISSVLRFAVSRGLAVYPRGTGSFAFGGAVPTRNGIVLDLSPMMSVLEVDPHERTIRAEPGTRWADLAAALEPHGLVPMTTPTSRFSTIAGWISTGGMGLDSYGYGSVYESVVGVRVVRPDGTAEALDPAEDSLRDLFGTEGQFGILTEVTLRARPKPEHSEAAMLAFDNADQAFGFIRDLNEGDMRPSHVVFFDREFLRKENLLFREHTGAKEAVVPEKEAVLLHFESPESARRFAASQAAREDEVSRNRVGAHYLWADRYFPLKAQRISPGLLGTEVMIPGSEVAGYIRKVRRLAGRFGLEPTTEVIVCRGEASFSYLVIVSFNCDYSRSLHYLLSLLFIQLSVRLAVRSRGGPYGTGIWNAPFVKARFDRGRLRELRRKKHELDPAETLNPGKFFRLKGRFFGIPSLFMRPVPFRMILAAAHAAAPVLGLGARLAGPKRSESWETPPKEEDLGRKLLHQSAQRCTSCGSCLSVCPAYHLTRDELVAGRTKLRMAEAILNGAALKPEEAFSPFQCLHCGLCEEVCQTRLPLRDCYLVLEDLLEDRFGSPADTVQRFVEKLDSDRAYIEDIFGLDLPRWSPSEQRTRAPTIEPDLKGGEA